MQGLKNTANSLRETPVLTSNRPIEKNQGNKYTIVKRRPYRRCIHNYRGHVTVKVNLSNIHKSRPTLNDPTQRSSDTAQPTDGIP